MVLPDEEEEEHPRLLLHNFLSVQECKELEYIHKSNCTVGYRPNVFSTTLSHLIATNCAHLIMPFVPIRGKSETDHYLGLFQLLIIYGFCLWVWD